MGIIRILLALSVLIGHVGILWGYKSLDGIIAVQAFYIISGFYISLILNEKYNCFKNSYRLFISNRFLRLYPIYWTVLILSITSSCFNYFINNNFGRIQPYITHYESMNIWSFLSLIFVNIFIIFQDAFAFLRFNTNAQSLFFTSNSQLINTPLHNFTLIPQAWTIGIEILFYIIAPFIVRAKTNFILFFIFLSICLRVLIYSMGFYHEPWIQRFFPTEIALFLAGAISYKLYTYIKTNNFTLNKNNLKVFWLLLIVIIIGFEYIPIILELKKWGFYILLTILLPYIFIYTKSNKYDTKIGEYSYPIYISHILVATIINVMLKGLITSESILCLFTIAATLIFSFILLKIIIEPIEKYRAKRVAKQI